MVCLTVLYPAPTNPDDFHRRYLNEHVPIVNRFLSDHGLTRWSMGRTLDALDKERRPVEFVANLYFDTSPEDVMEALSSPEGEDMLAHALALADNGLESHISVVEEWVT
jgi:uncharacterized protein (TIGR02118 family)